MTTDIVSTAASQVALTKARVQTEIAARLMKVAQETGGSQRVLELVRQVSESAAHTLEHSASQSGHMDVFG